jgi:hypothetical protein
MARRRQSSLRSDPWGVGEAGEDGEDVAEAFELALLEVAPAQPACELTLSEGGHPVGVGEIPEACEFELWRGAGTQCLRRREARKVRS